MTPKEKAQELVTKYMPVVGCDNKIQDDFEYQRAKLCALIAAEEIYETVKIAQTGIEEYWDYWQQVKSEIEKL